LGREGEAGGKQETIKEKGRDKGTKRERIGSANACTCYGENRRVRIRKDNVSFADGRKRGECKRQGRERTHPAFKEERATRVKKKKGGTLAQQINYRQISTPDGGEEKQGKR